MYARFGIFTIRILSENFEKFLFLRVNDTIFSSMSQFVINGSFYREFSIGYFSTIYNNILEYIKFENKTLESFFRKYFSQIREYKYSLTKNSY